MEYLVPKQSPVPDAIDRPFWDACNEERLIIQYCERCSRFQHPPEAACFECGSADRLGWREVSGRGTIYSYGVVYDTPIAALQMDQPYNVAVIDLDDAPGINVLSHLPGTPPDAVPIGAKVTLIFEPTQATGQKVPEWRIQR
jgi:hypothetical protein